MSRARGPRSAARAALVLALLALASFLAAASPVAGQGSGALRVEAALERTRAGRPLVTGYVYNDHGLSAYQVLLRVELLDGAGRVVARERGYVHGMIPPGDRLYFEASVPEGGADVRVAIEALTWGSPSLGGG